MPKSDKVRCSFCGKTQQLVKKIVAGPNNVYICDECIQTCNNIIENDYYDEEFTSNEGREKLLSPAEIKTILDEYVIRSR